MALHVCETDRFKVGSFSHSSVLQFEVRVLENKPGLAKVDAISKAQK